jgi:hypothetical protein
MPVDALANMLKIQLDFRILLIVPHLNNKMWNLPLFPERQLHLMKKMPLLESILETLIKNLGHECIFLPKFHCEPNPIEWHVAHNHCYGISLLFPFFLSIGDGSNIIIMRYQNKTLQR